jgi:hypothetical protein
VVFFSDPLAADYPDGHGFRHYPHPRPFAAIPATQPRDACDRKFEQPSVFVAPDRHRLCSTS